MTDRYSDTCSAFFPPKIGKCAITGHKPNKHSMPESETDWQTKQEDQTRFEMKDNPMFKANKQEIAQLKQSM